MAPRPFDPSSVSGATPTARASAETPRPVRGAAPAIEARGLTRRFRVGLGLRSRAALTGVDLTVARGTFLGLVGPNGSGKSTLVRLFAGVDRPTSGTLRILGSDPRSPTARRHSAYLPEDSPFPGELSAVAALDLLGALAGLARRESRTRGARLLADVGLEHAQKTPLRAFSRGMLRRFGLAQAFLTEPELVLLDEPTAGLDAPGFAVFDELLGGARARGATVVLASHLAADVHRHCDELVVLHEGRVVAEGPPATLLAAPGRTRLEVEGLDEGGREELESWLRARGATVTSEAPGIRGLSQLYASLASSHSPHRPLASPSSLGPARSRDHGTRHDA